MKKTFTLLCLAFMALALNAQTMKTITWDGQERQYLEYVPSTYSEAYPAPVLFMLHGLGDQADNFFQATQIMNVAEQKGWIVICPQALPFNLEIQGFGSQSFGNCWNSGVTVTISISMYGMSFDYDVPVNQDVDDEGFLMATLQTLDEEYNLCPDSLFFAGFSMGGFMSHRMAINHGDIINGIAAVSGLVGTDMVSFTPVDNVNVLQIFGTADEMIAYDDATINLQSYGTSAIGLPVESTVEYWRAFNQCDEEAVVEPYPDTFDDGLTFEMYKYLNGNNNSKVAFIKVYNGMHDWYSGYNHDIDYNTEIVKFFTTPSGTSDVAETSYETMTVFPNPAKDFINVGKEMVGIYDLCGKLVMQGSGRIDISSLPKGMYFLKSKTNCSKLIINR